MQFRSAALTLAILAGSVLAAPRPFVEAVMQRRQASSSSLVASATPAVSVIGSTWVPVPSATASVTVPSPSVSVAATTAAPTMAVMMTAMPVVTESVSVVIPAVSAGSAGAEGTNVIIMEGSAFYDAAMVMIDLMDAQGLDTASFKEMMGVSPL